MPYISDRLKCSLFAEQLGAVLVEHGSLRLVTASEPPAGIDYFTDWSKSSCKDWLVDEIVVHMKLYPNAIVLFEDIVSSPTDPHLSAQAHPPYWSHQGRMFWPVVPKGITPSNVEKVMAWSAGTGTFSVFSTLPSDFTLTLGTHFLSHNEFQHIASSITRLVTDVFDGGGYLVWEREKLGSVGHLT